MTISKGVSKVVSYKEETSWGTLAGALAGKQLRRVTASFNENAEFYESAEIRTDRQTLDYRKGVISAEGSLNGELSPSSYADFFQALLARDFTTGVTSATFAATIAASGDLWVITRDAGSFLTDGINVGDVVRLTGALNALNVGKNLLVASMTALTLTVTVLNNSAMFAEAAVAGVAAVVTGKKTYVPATAHTDKSFTVEEWYSDINQSEVYTGLKVGTANLQLPATGLVTVDFSMQGKAQTATGTTQYFTAPAVQGTNGIFASVQGAVIVQGVPVALITSADFNIERALENAIAVGSNTAAEIFTGRIMATGNLSVYFQDATFRDYFKNEDAVSLVFALTTNNEDDADFVSFVLPRVKLSSNTRDDGELGLTSSMSFRALLNADTTTGLIASTISIQDSTL